jgi:hypothetical protein
MGEIAFNTFARHPAHYASVFATNVLNLFALGRDEVLANFLPRTKGQWPGRFLSDDIKVDRIPDLNPSLMAPAHKWEANHAAAIVGFFRPTRAAPVLATLFLVAVALAILKPERRLVLIPAFALLAVLVINGIIAGDKPRYRYPLDPLFAVVGFSGLAMLVKLAGGLLRRGATSLSRPRMSVQTNAD